MTTGAFDNIRLRGYRMETGATTRILWISTETPMKKLSQIRNMKLPRAIKATFWLDGARERYVIKQTVVFRGASLAATMAMPVPQTPPGSQGNTASAVLSEDFGILQARPYRVNMSVLL